MIEVFYDETKAQETYMIPHTALQVPSPMNESQFSPFKRFQFRGVRLIH